jgi:phosphomannomutase
MSKLTCFKTYDIRGEVNVNFDEEIAYRIGRSVAQHFNAKAVVIGFDARETSPNFAAAASRGVRDTGSCVMSLGLAGTEEMYWAVTEFGACAGIEVTASHNPITYNGMKIVKSGSEPLDDLGDFQVIKKLAEVRSWGKSLSTGSELDFSKKARSAYVDRVLSFLDINALRPLKIVINSGNGAAGPTFDKISERLEKSMAPLEFVKVNHEPDHTFPNGIPNPLLEKNHKVMTDLVRDNKADFGVAFDGDFDRCFFFDEAGKFVPSEYIVGLIASMFLEREQGATIVHDPRVVWNTQDIVADKQGLAVQSKTGHAYIKKAMRENCAVYGGEMSAHHYFRDFAYCDSGMIPWLLIAEMLSQSRQSLGTCVQARMKAFPSSGEINFQVKDAQLAINKVLDFCAQNAISIDRTDGVSLSFRDWRFNLRSSNTEPLVRLNIETKNTSHDLSDKVHFIAKLLGGKIV